MIEKDDENNLPDGLWDELISESSKPDKGFKDRIRPAEPRGSTPWERFRNRLTAPFWLSVLLTFFCIYLYDHQFWMSTYELLRGIFVSLLVGLLGGDLFFVHAKRCLKVLLWLSAIALGAPILYSALISLANETDVLPLSLAKVFNSSPLLYPKGFCYLALVAFVLVKFRSWFLHSYVPWYEPNRATAHRRGLAFLGILLVISPLVLFVLLYRYAPSPKVSDWIAGQTSRYATHSVELYEKVREAPEKPQPNGGTIKIVSLDLQAEILRVLEENGHLAFPEEVFWLNLGEIVSKSECLDELRYWLALHNITDKSVGLWYPRVDLSVFGDSLKHDYSLSMEQLQLFEESLLRLGENLPSEREALEAMVSREWASRDIYPADYPTSFFSNNILNELGMNPLIHFKRAQLYSLIEMWLALRDSHPQVDTGVLSLPESQLRSDFYTFLSQLSSAEPDDRYDPSSYREYIDTLIAVCRIRRFNLKTRNIPQLSELNFDDLPSQIEIRYTELRDRTAVTVNCGTYSFQVYTK